MATKLASVPNLTEKSRFNWVRMRVWEKSVFLVRGRGMLTPIPAAHPLFEIYFIKFYNFISISTTYFNILLLFRNIFNIIILLFWKKIIRSLIINIIIVFCCYEKNMHFLNIL